MINIFEKWQKQSVNFLNSWRFVFSWLTNPLIDLLLLSVAAVGGNNPTATLYEAHAYNAL